MDKMTKKMFCRLVMWDYSTIKKAKVYKIYFKK